MLGGEEFAAASEAVLEFGGRLMEAAAAAAAGGFALCLHSHTAINLPLLPYLPLSATSLTVESAGSAVLNLLHATSLD